MNEPTPHILVVDDHRDIREPLAKYLAKHGYRVSAAENAPAARRLSIQPGNERRATATGTSAIGRK